MRTMRWLVLSLIAAAGVFGLTTVAQQQQPDQPVTEIEIVPENPTVASEITVELSGTFPNACAPDSAEATVEFNQVTIHTSNMSGFCAEGETTWSLSVPVGRLEAGPYRVVVLFTMEKDPEEYLLLGMKRLDVSGGGGALGDQAGQPGPLVPFTVSVQNQSRLGHEPWVPGPLFGVVKSQSNTSRSFDQLPATTGDPKGSVVTLGVTKSRSNTYRIVGCQSSDVKVVDDCTKPPIEEIKLEITGDDPILSFMAEQIELPDLTVDIRAIIVRRYTEREQVFCDITVFTTVRNGGKGAAGGVHLLGEINTIKSNTFRYGVGTGGIVTKSEILIRQPRGQGIVIEAEVKSLSIGESNTANNRATQSVTCL